MVPASAFTACFALTDDIILASENSLSAGLDKEKDLYYASFSTYDCKEGMTAFLEKRPPHFQHR